jgi:hypothetical protein
MTHIAVIHHLRQPFLGDAAAPLDEVTEYFGGALPELDTTGAIVSFGGEKSAWDPEFAPVRTPTPSRPSRSALA